MRQRYRMFVYIDSQNQTVYIYIQMPGFTVRSFRRLPRPVGFIIYGQVKRALTKQIPVNWARLFFPHPWAHWQLLSSNQRPVETYSSIDALTDEEVYTLIQNWSDNTAIRSLKDSNILFTNSIWRISEDAVAKVTYSPTEVFMVSYVSSHTSIPVPKIRRVLPGRASDATGTQWIIMDYINGNTLETEWPRMSWWKRLYTMWSIRRYIREIHNVPIPNPDAPGRFDDSARSYECRGYYFTEDGAGPFRSYLDMAAWFDRRRFNVLAVMHSAIGVVPCYPRFTMSHPLVLCHMDLHMRNFVVDSEGKIWLIDWANSGAFPPWLEYAQMALWADAAREDFRPPKLGYSLWGLWLVITGDTRRVTWTS